MPVDFSWLKWKGQCLRTGLGAQNPARGRCTSQIHMWRPFPRRQALRRCGQARCCLGQSCNFSGEAIQRHARKRTPDRSVDRAPVRANAAIFLKRAFMARFFNAGGHGDGAFDRFDNIRKAYTCGGPGEGKAARSEEQTSELQSLTRNSYAV